MAIKLLDGKFACSFCYQHYNTAIKADTCRDSHDLIYVPMTSSELNGLLHFIAFGEYAYLQDSLRERLERCAMTSQTNRDVV